MKSGVTRTLALVGLAACSLTACDSQPDIKHGTVTAKRHLAEYTHTDMVPIYGCMPTFDANGNMSCTSTIISWDSETTTDPECWELTLKDGSLTGTVCVTKQTYDSAWVGSYKSDSEN